MVWIFASVVLIMAVISEGFRKLLIWAGGGAAALLVIAMAISAHNDRIARNWSPPQADFDAYQSMHPHAEETVPDSDLPDNLKQNK
jgi:hypothetical protein